MHENPDVAVMFFAGVMAGENAFGLDFVLVGTRRDFDALAAACIEAPAVVAAFDGFAVEAAVGERNSTMRAGVAHRERFAIRGPTEHERDFEEHRGCETLADDFGAAKRGVPEIPKKAEIVFTRVLSRRSVVDLRQNSSYVAHDRLLIDVCAS